MSFVKGSLTEEQKKRIDENRKRALARIQKNSAPNEQSVRLSHTHKDNGHVAVSGTESHFANNKRAKVDITPEQRNKIESNRQRALEIRKKKEQNNRNAASVDIRISKGQEESSSSNSNSRFTRPSIKTKDYIEYDFSTMKDSKGGFISVDDSNDTNQDSKSLEEWKEKQNQQHVVRELPPPMDPASAPKCYECGSLELDPNLYANFNQVRVCRKCAKKMPEKYALLTKTECREDYLLTDPELRDKSLLPRIEKPNPHGYSRMQLYLRFQVEEFAWKKWGSAEGLDQEWERREEQRLKRKDKKYQEQLREMRKRTRAEEYTRKLRDGYNLGERHVHDWSAPVIVPGGETVHKRRCIDCGVETEEVFI